MFTLTLEDHHTYEVCNDGPRWPSHDAPARVMWWKMKEKKEWQSGNERTRAAINWKVTEKKTRTLSLRISIPHSLQTEKRDKIPLVPLSLSLSLLKETHANVQQDHPPPPHSLYLSLCSLIISVCGCHVMSLTVSTKQQLTDVIMDRKNYTAVSVRF